VFPAGTGPVTALLAIVAVVAEKWGCVLVLGSNHKMKTVSSHKYFFAPDSLV
jgi:hypothetical protein